MLKWNVGDVEITKIVELESTGGIDFILPQAKPEAVRDLTWMRPHFMDERGRLKASVHALLVETPDRRILVDTCIGNDKPRMPIKFWHNLQTKFMDDLEAAGGAPESVDTILCTHLHLDHVGWNTMLVDGRWVPTFPSARYLIARTEYEHWRVAETDGVQQAVLADSVAPVFDAGLVDLVETGHRVCPEVDLVPTVGHTPGHVSVRIRSRGAEALITGDFVHHPCQMAHVDWASSADTDPTRGIETRRQIFERYVDTPTLIIGTHFAGATAGRLRRDGEAYRLEV